MCVLELELVGAKAEYGEFGLGGMGQNRTGHVDRVDNVTSSVHLVDNVASLQCNSLVVNTSDMVVVMDRAD